MKYLIFNLKSKLNYKEVPLYLKKLDEYLNDCIIAPGYLYLERFAKNNFSTCSQDVSMLESGSYTGEISAQQLKNVGCDYVLIGHFERRKYFKEDSTVLVAKIKQAIKWQLKVVLCVGEEGSSFSFAEVKEQIDEIFQYFNNQELKQLIIAYEPSFMIGTNAEIDYDALEEILKQIRFYIFDHYKANIDLIYGGSVNLKTVNKVKKLPIDGLLIGDLATSLDSMLTLINQLKQ